MLLHNTVWCVSFEVEKFCRSQSHSAWSAHDRKYEVVTNGVCKMFFSQDQCDLYTAKLAASKLSGIWCIIYASG